MDNISDIDGYKQLAPFYNKYWTQQAPGLFEKALNKALLPSIPTKGEILDLCCGTGQLCARLSHRLFRVTGLDISAEMIRIAKINAPAADFTVQDATQFSFDTQFDAVISMFDSINHILTYEKLVDCFTCVKSSLKPDGKFFFDVNNLTAFNNSWEDGFSAIDENSACIVKPLFDFLTNMSIYTITLFSLEDGLWKRHDLKVHERYYTEAQIAEALATAGFFNIKVMDGYKDLKIKGFSDRLFFLAE